MVVESGFSVIGDGVGDGIGEMTGSEVDANPSAPPIIIIKIIKIIDKVIYLI